MRPSSRVAIALLCVFVGCGSPDEEEALPDAAVPQEEGPRVSDWRGSRLVGVWGTSQPHRPPIGPAAALPLADWNVRTGAAVVGAAAVYGPSFTTPSSSDSLYFVTSASGTGTGLTNAATDVQSGYPAGVANNNLFRLGDLYATGGKPRVDWAVTIAGGSSSSIVLSVDGSKVYVVSKSGVLCCRAAATGATCAGWTDYSAGATVDLSSPWLNSAGTALYFGDAAGYLHKVDAATGGSAAIWKKSLGTRAVHSSPTEVDGIVYVGDDGGTFYRVVDPGTTAPTVVQGQSLCTSAGCAIYASAAVDIDQSAVFIAANGTVSQFVHDPNPAASATWASPVTRNLPNRAQAIVWSSPTLDWDNGYLYLGHNNRLYKLVYPQTGSSAQYSVALQGSGGSNTYPRGMPLVWTGSVFVGSGAGRAERYGCTGTAANPAFKSYTASYGTEVSTPIVLDNATGNVNFGYASATGGGLVQYPQDPTQWACPGTNIQCAAQTCGEVGCGASSCLPACATVPSTVLCQAVPEHATVTFTCPTGTTIRSVLSASYGMPVQTTCSSPPEPMTEGPCGSATSLSFTRTQCLNKTTCTFTAENANFGDPCYGTFKHYYGVVACDAVPGRSYCSQQGATSSCDPATGSCAGACATGFADCNSNLVSDGCETDLTSDPNNCGACGVVCSTSHVVGARCRGGQCDSACSPGYGDCDHNVQTNGCEHSNSCTDCCGVRCTTGQECFAGTCKAAGSYVCATAKDTETFQMACPTGETFASFTFARYGTPGGTCGAFTAGACDADVTSYLQTQCGGKSSCSFLVDGTSMGIPCETPKWLEVQAVCTNTPSRRCP